jgi:hypothetical protein
MKTFRAIEMRTVLVVGLPVAAGIVNANITAYENPQQNAHSDRLPAVI